MDHFKIALSRQQITNNNKNDIDLSLKITEIGLYIYVMPTDQKFLLTSTFFEE